MKLLKLFPLAVLSAVVPALAGQSISVEELADRLVAGEVPFLVDVRRSHEYAKAHIPNAVNIPAQMLGSRRLPPIGEVIVYGDGLGREDMEAVMKALAEKPGITPVYLEGGFASWNTRSGVNTGAPGLQDAVTPVITYQALLESGGEGVILYDLRKGKGAEGSPRLGEHFPKARLANGSPYALLKSDKASTDAAGASLAGKGPDAAQGNPLLRRNAVSSTDLIVLIDDDHQSAERMANRLRAGGFQRVAILAGGEMIMEFEGRPGLERRGRGSIRVTAGEAEEALNESTGENP